ncbi:NTP pyrophosphohydrolase [Streptomyces albidoflavus]|uniref:NUDIX hydrolase n=1 Tax=Streptomyces albidoflavus TaxID=1886 RepID=UPI000BADDB0A|nr:NUDIX hydrolase [Streptomyces albidoflavus]PAX82037.1 NTP pyrophosphohydrolase [Streptomyces albidoflavus]PAX91680.1 NTP pyrophosphohydrolase [Streptomyces albidoflavus]PBO19608.1 NTP pyrophosphohydrolase [Streptomyces albidoflavus]PBO25386.1 NTP pyrophosphohydrolase [Streptomyces albidoflavus]PBO29736.1 NTP pyrophosphohydrolase [Streptomyces albidoflavus]
MANTPHASVIVARDAQGHIALLSSHFPQHGGEYLFLPGGRFENDETPLECAQRELLEEAGVASARWEPLGSFTPTLASPARVHLFLAEDLTLGPQQLTPSEADFKLTWWPMHEALAAVQLGQFLLPAGPLALFLAAQHSSTAPQGTGTGNEMEQNNTQNDAVRSRPTLTPVDRT